MTEEAKESDYAHSRAHHLVYLNDSAGLSRLLSTLPSLSHPSSILSLSDSLRELRLSATVSAVLDRRDVAGGDTPLHLAVRLNRSPSLLSSLLLSGADPSLRNSAGWSPLHEAVSLRRRRLAGILLRHYRLAAWAKFRRRLPLLLPALRRVPDFYLEMSFRFESSLVPFLLPRAAPSDTYRVWKRGGDVRADTSLAGFDGIRTRRADRSFVFLEAPDEPLPVGSLVVLHHGRREVHDAFSGIGDLDPDDELITESAACRPGLNFTSAELVPRTGWRGRDKTELIANTWKSRVYDLNNVLFSFKTLHSEETTCVNDDICIEEEDVIVPLEIREEDDGDFLVADIAPARRSCYEPRRRSRAAVAAEVEIAGGRRRRSVDVLVAPPLVVREERSRLERKVKSEEKETVKNLRPTVWLTEEFPLKIEEIMPLLDILSNGVRAVRRLKELLTTKFPPGTFPVKVAIPVVPTVRVVVTFTKFVPLQPELFFTPLSSPSLLERKEEKEQQQNPKKEASNKATSWLKWGTSNNNASPNKNSLTRSKSVRPSDTATESMIKDPFLIPIDYTWVTNNNVGTKNTEFKKSKSRREKTRS